MKLSQLRTKSSAGFTLIEMIGVLAVIAILASLLIPKVLSAINDSRVNSTVASYNSVKAASMEYFGKYGRFGTNSGGAFTAEALAAGPGTNWASTVLMPEGFLDKPFALKIGNTAYVRVRTIAAAAADASNAAYNLDGVDPGTDLSGGQYVVEAQITGVSAEDAKAINDRIDGPDLGGTQGNADLLGRVKFPAIGSGASGDVLIYIAHK